MRGSSDNADARSMARIRNTRSVFTFALLFAKSYTGA